MNLFIYVYLSTNCRRQDSACGLCEVGVFQRGCLRLFCWCFTDSGANVMIFMLKEFRMYHKRYPKRPTWSQKGSKRREPTNKAVVGKIIVIYL